MVDEELVEQVQQGNIHLFNQIVEKYKNRMFKLAYSFTYNYTDCEDLCQEIFILAFKKINSFNFKCKFSTWMYRIATNRCIDWQRKNARINNKIISIDTNDDWTGRSFSICQTPEDDYINYEQNKALHDALATLDIKYRLPIIMYHFQGMKYREIGEVLEIKERTVETRIYRGKQKIRQILLENNLRGECYEMQSGKS
ncbi:MAG: RNA polymerase sigma factor [Clostridia bacterium]|nr:RNA polymerase sigma factor [Clostridia bacterium]